MNTCESLVFPDTDIFSEQHYPLLLFFTPLHFLQLIEPGNGATPAIHHDAELFLQRGLCRAHIPAPLGDNRPQFLRLIDDIRKRREHYFTQLKILATAPRASPADNAKNGVVSALLQEFGIRHQQTEADLSLWKARLVLAMAEILDADQEEVREEFAEQLESFHEEITALRSSQEAQGTEEVELLNELDDIMAQLEKPRVKDAVNRVEAWLRLAHNRPLPSVKVWVATHRDSGEQLFARYEAASHASAVPVLKLALPAHIDASAQYVIRYIEEFHRETATIHRGLVADFERLVRTVPYSRSSPELLLPYGVDWAEQWEGKLDRYFPAGKDGRSSITFYLLPDQPIGQLLSQPDSPGASPDHVAHGLLGILGAS